MEPQIEETTDRLIQIGSMGSIRFRRRKKTRQAGERAMRSLSECERGHCVVHSGFRGFNGGLSLKGRRHLERWDADAGVPQTHFLMLKEDVTR